MTRDPELVRLAVRRFHELQGLRTIVLAVACTLAFWSQPFIKELRYAGPFAAMLGLVLSVLPFAGVLMGRPVDGYYSRRFGRVAATPIQRARDIGVPLMVVLGGLWFDSINLGQGWPSGVLLAGAALALHNCVRDWPWRSYYLGTAVACAAGAWLAATVPSLAPATMPELARGPVTWLLASFVLPAYLDHRLLVRALPGRPVADEVGVAERG